MWKQWVRLHISSLVVVVVCVILRISSLVRGEDEGVQLGWQIKIQHSPSSFISFLSNIVSVHFPMYKKVAQWICFNETMLLRNMKGQIPSTGFFCISLFSWIQLTSKFQNASKKFSSKSPRDSLWTQSSLFSCPFTNSYEYHLSKEKWKHIYWSNSGKFSVNQRRGSRGVIINWIRSGSTTGFLLLQLPGSALLLLNEPTQAWKASLTFSSMRNMSTLMSSPPLVIFLASKNAADAPPPY